MSGDDATARRFRMTTLLRIAARLWASPCSLAGLLVAVFALPFGARMRIVDGVLEVALTGSAAVRARLSRRLRFHAITLGHVVVGLDRDALERSRAHERVHVRQYERWGIAFFVAYPAESLWQLLRGRRAYRDNRFEVQARRRSGDVE